MENVVNPRHSTQVKFIVIGGAINRVLISDFYSDEFAELFGEPSGWQPGISEQ